MLRSFFSCLAKIVLICRGRLCQPAPRSRQLPIWRASRFFQSLVIPPIQPYLFMLKLFQKPSIKVSTTRSNGERVHRGPSTPADSPLPAETSEDLPQCSSSVSCQCDQITCASYACALKAVKDEPESCEKDDLAIELPSSSVEVPPVPTYEEIEQCIYKVENKKKAMSLMYVRFYFSRSTFLAVVESVVFRCFCRGNNLDCSDSRCDNRAMFTECPKNCLGKNKDCRNRRFSKVCPYLETYC